MKKKPRRYVEPLPRPPCGICAHPRLDGINKALYGGIGLSKAAAELKVHKPALARHKDFCLRGARGQPLPMAVQIPVTSPDGLAPSAGAARTTVDSSAYTDLGEGSYMVKREVVVAINRTGLRMQVIVAPLVLPPAAVIATPPKGLAVARHRIWKGDS